MASKFSKEIFEALEAAAPLDFEKVTAIAEKFGEKPKALVAAVGRAGIEYKRKARVSKSGEPVVTKEALVATITETLGLEAGELEGLEKATKSVLTKIATAIEG